MRKKTVFEKETWTSRDHPSEMHINLSAPLIALAGHGSFCIYGASTSIAPHAKRSRTAPPDGPRRFESGACR